MIQSITLNLPYDLTDAQWAKVQAVYESMDGWIPDQEIASWFGSLNSPQYVVASVEPGGLLLEGNLESLYFRGWLTKLCARLTVVLGLEIHDAEV